MCFTSELQPSIWQGLLVKCKVTANLSCCLALGWGGAGGTGELHDAINTNYICLAILVTWEAEAMIARLRPAFLPQKNTTKIRQNK